LQKEKKKKNKKKSKWKKKNIIWDIVNFIVAKMSKLNKKQETLKLPIEKKLCRNTSMSIMKKNRANELHYEKKESLKQKEWTWSLRDERGSELGVWNERGNELGAWELSLLTWKFGNGCKGHMKIRMLRKEKTCHYEQS
jgi:hypothetical protein